MRKQYHFWPAEHGFDAWDVDRLIELSRDLPVERVPIDSIREIDTMYWFDGNAELPTVRKVAEHAKLIAEVDPSYPIILGHDGRVMDGMHRIARAALEGRREVEAVRFPAPVEPDFESCLPHELPLLTPVCERGAAVDGVAGHLLREMHGPSPSRHGGGRNAR